MRLFKNTYPDDTGNRRKAETWSLDFRDHNDIRRRIPLGIKNRRVAEDIGRKIEKLAAIKSAGEQPDMELTRWMENIPVKMRERLVKIGLISPQRGAAGKSLSKHLEDFRDNLKATNTAAYAEKTYKRAKKIFDESKCSYWTDVSPSKVENTLAKLETKESLSQTTRNYHLQAVKQFSRWMVRDGRATTDPLLHLKKISVTERQRRASFEVDEMKYLLAVIRQGPDRAGLSGDERALIYQIGIETGLRRSELASLTVGSFDLVNGSVNVLAKNTKNKKTATLPLRDATCDMLREYFSGKLTGAKALAIPGRTAEMIHADMQAAREQWLDEVKGSPEILRERTESDFLQPIDHAGRKKDFHSLRTTCGSWLAAFGVHPRTIQQILRHSDVRLSMQYYTHTLSGQEAQAVNALPDLTKSIPRQQRKTGTDEECIVVAQSRQEGSKYHPKTPAKSPAKFCAQQEISMDNHGPKGNDDQPVTKNPASPLPAVNADFTTGNTSPKGCSL